MPAIAITAIASGSTAQRTAWTVRGRLTSVVARTGRLSAGFVVANGHVAANGLITGCCIAIAGASGIVESGASCESSNA
ncbi:hypothetical protein [Variovorax sp. Sphag1AA]|uniref:hypothetical protein n=1 Tax=Variovorax sp. Sphag1AA TaxID=2587027 RepID=UPI00161B9389|nr:hypothetical protein [Variovorax sp. Sphag1AA]MBB3179244.1 hypothetical protein [Variovorax sp. Sphag1AA]